jgi:hypothetical protein
MKPQLEDVDEPPKMSVLALAIITVISGGAFLWIWMVMQAMWVHKVNPASKVSMLAWISVVPAALFYINLPSLLMATRANDQTEIARLHVAMVLWGTIAALFLIATLAWLAQALRRLKKG